MAAKKKDARGGPRPGSGRPALFDDRVGITTQMERADYEALTEVAEARGISIGALIREAIRRHLARRRKR